MDRFRALFEVNVFATLETVQIAARKLVNKGSGKIVFLSSIAGLSGTPYVGPYTATKHAIEGIAKTMQKELAEFGVQVATINPGPYNTGFNDRSADEKWKWFDEERYFTKKEDMLKQEEHLKDQYDPQEMIEKMIELIPADHHKYRTVFPPEMEKKMKNDEKERWELDV